jgi:PBP1b-binding outer membrane lipoprotein LpoB
MNAFKSAVARSAVVLAFVLSGCASLAPSGPSDYTPYDAQQLGGF